jgi:hypothetical protein
MPPIYAFDVDHTLEVSDGPVALDAVVRLRRAAGAVVGLCGNWALVTRTVPGWHDIFSFVGPIAIPKAEMLQQIRRSCPADDYVMVGNDPRLYGNSDDVGAAAEAGWRFIREHDFAAGVR